jgi:predicted ribosome quality control (RQC) complex YloA/Tae2 family protein
MTQVQRYNPSILRIDFQPHPQMHKADDGEYVKYSDIQQALMDLVIENAALKNAIEYAEKRLAAENAILMTVIEELKERIDALI